MSSPTIPFATAGFVSGGAFTYYGLLSDGDDVVSRSGTLQQAAAKQLRGTPLKFDPATGNVTALAVESDANCILAIDCDATAANAPCQVYVGGKFKADAIIWPAALSHALITNALRNYDIQVESVEFTDGSLVKSSPTKAQEEAAKAVVAENRAREKKAADEQTKAADDPGRDSPWAYLTADERANDPGLATIHDREDEEEKDKQEASRHGGKPDEKAQQHQPPPHQKTPNKGGD